MLIDICTANPPYKVSQTIAASGLKKRMADRPAIERIIESASFNSGIDNRYIVIPDAESNAENKFYSNNRGDLKPDTQSRMAEYEKWSKILAKQSVSDLLVKNKINAKQIDKLITISCTGFFAPGLDYFLIEEFNIPHSVKRINIGFMGCAASIIGFNSVLDALNSVNKKEMNTLLISIELCSLHLQTDPTRDNIIANLIFGDGCAAALFSNSSQLLPKLNLIWVESFLFENSAEYMGWKIGNFGFEMMLSSNLPKIILNEAAPRLKKILDDKNIKKENIKHWALHPGGRAILDSMQNGLGLSDEQLKPSREILRKYGNMSSASILFVLKEIFDTVNINKGDYCCAVAFGPGLTMEIALFECA